MVQKYGNVKIIVYEPTYNCNLLCDLLELQIT